MCRVLRSSTLLLLDNLEGFGCRLAERDLANGFTPSSMPFKYGDLMSTAPRMAFSSPALCLVAGETSTTPKPRSQFKVRTLGSLLVPLRVIGQSNSSDLPSMVTRIVSWTSRPCPVA